MSVRQDRVQVAVDVDVKQGINELGKFEAEAFDLRKTIAGLKKDTDEWREANARLSEVTKQIQARREALGMEGMTTRQLRNYVRELRAEQENTATAGTERYQLLGAKIQQATEKVNEHVRAQRGLKQSLDQIRERVTVDVIVDAAPATNQLRQVEAEAAALEAHVHTLKRGSEEWIAAMDALDESRDRIGALREELGTAGMTMQQLRSHAADLQNELDTGAVAGTERYEQQKLKLQEVNAAIEKQRTELKAVAVSQEEVAKAAGESLDAVQRQAKVSVVVDGSPASNELTQLEREVAALQQHVRKLKPDSEEAAQAVARIGAGEARIQVLRKEIGTAGMTMEQLRSHAKALESQLETTAVRGTEHYKQLKGELLQVSGAIQRQEKEVAGMSGIWKSISSEVKQFGMLAIGALGLQWLSGQVTNIITKNGQLADSYSDIKKTTGMTADEVRDLSEEFSRMDTRTPTKELREVAVAAGQLGIAKDDILEFTDATDKMVVSLGDEFEGGAQQVTKVMGGLRNVFSDIKSDNVAEDMLHIGNAVNVLASEGASTGPVLTDMSNRIGGVGIVLGLTSGQVLGLSATMQELNIETERGSTATVKILQKMAAEPEKFAKVAGMSVKEFKRLVDTDLNAAFLAVAKGAAGSGASATTLAHILDELGVDGAGAGEVMAKLGQNTDMVAQKQATAAKALGETSSILSEFNEKNTNAQANLERLGKWFGGLFVNSTAKKWLDDIVGGLARMLGLIDKTKELTSAFDQQQSVVQNLQTRIIPLLARHDELQRKSSLNTAEQKELEEIIRQVTDAVPQAATQFDKYGKALGLNADVVKRYNEEQKNMLKYTNQQAIAQTQEDIARLTQQINLLDKSLNMLDENGKRSRLVTVRAGDHLITERVEYTSAEIKKMASELARLQGLMEGAKANLAHLRGDQTQAEQKAEWDRLEREEAARNAKLKREASAGAAEAKGLLERIDEQLKAARDRMNKAGSQAGIDAERAEINRLEAQRKELTGEAAAERERQAEERRKALQKQHEEARQGLAMLVKLETESREKIELDRLAADRREILEIRRKYDELKAQAIIFSTDSRLTAKERADALVEIARIEAAEELEVEAKRDQQKAQRAEESWRRYREHQQAQAALEVMLAENAVQDAEKNGTGGDQQHALEHLRDMRIQELEVEKQVALDSLAVTKDNEQKRLDIIAAYNARIQQVRQQSGEEIKKSAAASVQQFFDYVNQAAQAVGQLLQLSSSGEMNRLNRDKQSRLQALDNEYSRRKMSQEAYQRQKEKIEADAQRKSEEVQQKQAKREQELRLVQAIINTAAAVMRAAAEEGPGAALAMGLIGALQTATIASAVLPGFVEGGFTADELSAMPHRNLSRSSGGMLPTGPFVATVNEAGPEYFIPNRLLSDPVVFNAVNVIEAIRTTGRYQVSRTETPGFVEGGSTSTMPPAFTHHDRLTEPTASALASQLARLNQNLENPREARARLAYSDLEHTQDEVTYIRKLSSL